jgi:hypothetical protein
MILQAGEGVSDIGSEEPGLPFMSKFQQPFVMPRSHYDGYNVWILKPTGLNRGKGIHVVNSAEEVQKIIKQTCIENFQPK